MESEGNGKKSLGNFRNMKTTGICFEDLTNAFTFFSLLLNTNSLIKWLMDNRLLASDVKCEKCNAACSLYKRIKMPDGVAWICKKKCESRNFHTKTFISFQNEIYHARCSRFYQRDGAWFYSTKKLSKCWSLLWPYGS